MQEKFRSAEHSGLFWTDHICNESQMVALVCPGKLAIAKLKACGRTIVTNRRTSKVSWSLAAEVTSTKAQWARSFQLQRSESCIRVGLVMDVVS
jgi:hypothetical protein